MTIWGKYHLIYFGGPCLSFSIFLVFLSMGFTIISISVFGIGILVSVILALRIICPKCGTPLSSSNSLFSKHYTGFHFLLPTDCVNCGYDLDSNTDMPDTDSGNIQAPPAESGPHEQVEPGEGLPP
jgi:hypothetical protein